MTPQTPTKHATAKPGFLFALNKPKGITSHDCVDMVRKALHTRRVGHAGTLDPFATGVLVMGVNQATKALGLIAKANKSYDATILFGSATNTDDITGTVAQTAPVPQEVADPTFAQNILKRFLGESEQIPPQFSAISKDGVKAYKSAREGKHVELAARPVSITKAELLAIGEQTEAVTWRIRVDVSSGCYIRALARDIGIACNTVATLADLSRTRVAKIDLSQAILPKDIKEAQHHCLNPLVALDVAPYELSDEELKHVLLGRAFEPKSPCAHKVGVVFKRALFGIWELKGPKLMCRNNFCQSILGAATC